MKIQNFITKYPDGTSYADVNDKNYGVITFKINSYEDLWHLGQIIETANHNGTNPTVTIPNLIDAQADRRFKKTQSSGLKLVCKWLNSFNVLEYRIFHPHNPEVVESLLNRVEIIDNRKFISQVTWQLHLSKVNNLTLMSSDAGGFKPLMKLCEIINWKGETFSASKARSWDEKTGTKFVQQIDKADFEGKDILIVDDICVYGGTFKGLSKLLKEKNVGKLYLAVSHMTVQNLGEDPVTNYFDKVFTTNSKYDNYYTYDGQGYDKVMGVEPKNLQIINLW